MSDICYNYHPITGEYIGQSTFRRDPIERLPLVPAHATLIAPPDPVAGMVAVFSGAAWSLVEDHRGESGYVGGEPMTVVELGPLPEGWSPEPPATSLAKAYTSAVDSIKNRRQQTEQGGFDFDGIHVGSDREDQSMIQGAVAYSNLHPEHVFRWQVAPDDFISIDHTVMLAIGDALGAHVQAAFSRQDELVGQVQAIRDDTELDESERVEAIEAFLSANLNTGWPGQV